MEMHAVVAEGTGFIDTHLCRAPVERGWWATCVDNLGTGSRNAPASLRDDPRMEFVAADARALPHLSPAARVFNLGWCREENRVIEVPVGELEDRLRDLLAGRPGENE